MLEYKYAKENFALALIGRKGGFLWKEKLKWFNMGLAK